MTNADNYISSYNNCRYLISRMDRDELLEELDRRGWQGELRKVQIVTIGTK